MDSFLEDEQTIWPSYVDFLLSFCFVLVLSLGYMAFVSVHGIEGEDFRHDAMSGQAALKELGLSPRIDWNEHRVYIPMPFVTFDSGCPLKKGCPAELTSDQQEKLRELASMLSSKFTSAHTILLRGQADRTRGKDDFYNFRVASDRAIMVYGVLLNCEKACGLTKSHGSLDKVQLDNVGDTQASGEGSNKDDRTVTLILDYSR